MNYPPAYVYQCPRCGLWWRRWDERCLVLHEPGDCCHYGDTPMNEPTPKERDG